MENYLNKSTLKNTHYKFKFNQKLNLSKKKFFINQKTIFLSLE